MDYFVISFYYYNFFSSWSCCYRRSGPTSTSIRKYSNTFRLYVRFFFLLSTFIIAFFTNLSLQVTYRSLVSVGYLFHFIYCFRLTFRDCVSVNWESLSVSNHQHSPVWFCFNYNSDNFPSIVFSIVKFENDSGRDFWLIDRQLNRTTQSFTFLG